MGAKGRILALSALLLLLGCALVFASGGGEKASAEKPTIRIVVYDESDTKWSADLWQSQQLANAGGVTFQYLAIAGADFAVKRNAWLASGDLPDIWQDRVENPKDMVDTYGPKGLILAVNKYYAQLPNLQKYMQKYPDYDKAMKAVDGNTYGIAYINDFVPFQTAPAIREYMLKEKGMDPRKDIQTMDDLYKALQIIKQYVMDKKNLNTFPWAARDPGGFIEKVGPMWGVTQRVFYDDETQKFDYGPANPRFKVMVDFLAKAYKAGLIHPDIWSMPDEVMEGLSNKEEVNFWVDNIWNGYAWGEKQTGPNAAVAMSVHPFTPILPPTVNGKRYYASRAGSPVVTNQLWVISAKTKYLDNILKMVNWGFSEEGVYAMAMGKEDYTYVKDPKSGLRIWPAPGLFTYTRSYNPETGEIKAFTEVGDGSKWTPPKPWVKLMDEFPWKWRAFRNFNNFVWPIETSVPTMYEAAPLMFKDKDWLLSNKVIAPAQPSLTFTKDELDRRKVIETPLTTYSDEMVVKFTTGQEPMANWDAFVRKLKDLKVDEVVSIYNAALDRYRK